MRRIVTYSERPIAHPTQCISVSLLVQPAGLFVHHYGDRQVQIWLRDGDKWIGDIKDGHPHPSLKNYCLYVPEGREPTWVTKKTRSSYKAKKVREARQRALDNAAVAR